MPRCACETGASGDHAGVEFLAQFETSETAPSVDLADVERRLEASGARNPSAWVNDDPRRGFTGAAYVRFDADSESSANAALAALPQRWLLVAGHEGDGVPPIAPTD
jgi:hypothetical protein